MTIFFMTISFQVFIFHHYTYPTAIGLLALFSPLFLPWFSGFILRQMLMLGVHRAYIRMDTNNAFPLIIGAQFSKLPITLYIVTISTAKKAIQHQVCVLNLLIILTQVLN